MRTRRAGFTLFESVLGLFILATAAIAASRMLDTASRTTGILQDEALALVEAQTRVREIRRWAAGTEFGRFRFDGTNQKRLMHTQEYFS